MSHPKLKLTYFDIHGGRAEPARIAMAIGGIPFEDCRISFPDFKDLRQTFPFCAVPVLEVDGTVVTQSNAMNRYLGKLAGLYPTDDWQAFRCDEVMDAVEDIGTKVVATFGIEDPQEKKAARVALAGGWLPTFLNGLEQILAAQGGEYFADSRLTVADLRVFVWMRSLRSGVLDHIPTDLADSTAPALVKHHDRVAEHPGVKAYYERVMA